VNVNSAIVRARRSQKLSVPALAAIQDACKIVLSDDLPRRWERIVQETRA
jgi:hypothetical protein